MRRFLRPILRRPLPVFLTPTVLSLWVTETCTVTESDKRSGAAENVP